jgi:large subunit ribosomal protein L21e
LAEPYHIETPIYERCLMVKKSHGFRARTRGLMSKRIRQKGLSSPSKILIDYEEGQRVDIVIDPGFHRGMPHKRYHGRTGVITGLRGRAVVVDVGLGKATKSLIIRREHLRPSRS